MRNPGNSTAKTWLYQRYRIPAMTYETGDDSGQGCGGRPGGQCSAVARRRERRNG